jgi:photosystem II protein PsbQ
MTMLKALRRLAAICLCVALSLGLMAPAAVDAAGINPDDLAVIRRQAAAFEATKSRLPDLARLVSAEDWVFTRNLLHGPMQEVGREMSYINQRLDRSERKDADKIARKLKEALADLDEAARLQDGSRLQRSYSNLAASFDAYSEVIPAEAFS